jgi:hypothetical protein
VAARSRFIGTTALLVLGLVVIADFLGVEPAKRIRLYNDDALFYGIIAANTAAGHPFSFDGGISVTTGFHWAGMAQPLLTALVHRLLTGQAAYASLFPWLYVIDAGAIVVAALLVALSLRGALAHPLLALVIGLAVAKTAVAGFGTEMIVLLPLVTAFIVAVADRTARTSPWRYVVLPALIPLARLDYVPLMSLVTVLGLFVPTPVWRCPTYRRRALMSLAGLAAGAGLVLLLNTLVGGHPLSSSMLAKSAVGFSLTEFIEQVWYHRVGFILFPLLLALHAWLVPSRRSPALLLTVAGAAILA